MAAWLRLYTEMMDDPKVGQLTDGEFRTWIGLLCLAGKADAEGDTKHTVQLAGWALRRPVDADCERLLTLQLVSLSKAKNIVITKWSKRQYRSDSSLERVRKHRNSNCDAPLQKRPGNGPEQNRTDTEQNRTERADKSAGFDAFWKAYPKKVGKGQALRAWRSVSGHASAIMADLSDRKWPEPQFIPNPATYLNGQRWLDERVPDAPVRRRGDPVPTVARPLSDADRARAEEALRRERERADRLAAEGAGLPRPDLGRVIGGLARSKRA